MRRWPSPLRRHPRRSAEDRQRRILVRAIRRLPRDYRDVFVLHRFAGMSLEQIAEHPGIDQQAVETRLTEALVRLSRAVDEAGGWEPSEGQ
ncbi:MULTISPECIES: sigma-70 family RNA polymerase sigma factor [Brevundimonas]|jgi:RNA polymerase sigma factor (sigma-70 family)|uniref:sigma-70 region 4 domain-containing protein n=1 Tax=Brevundimonas sp. 357 TaxID=2555782 RepID=UPI000F79C068|nr:MULTISPECIES: sigma-70 region 4 domain-containing protein [Brevundimonas]RSB47911.1 sigma-70 family RNA polymerase sigma factor [Brevundimonas sp. 357]